MQLAEDALHADWPPQFFQKLRPTSPAGRPLLVAPNNGAHLVANSITDRCTDFTAHNSTTNCCSFPSAYKEAYFVAGENEPMVRRSPEHLSEV